MVKRRCGQVARGSQIAADSREMYCAMVPSCWGGMTGKENWASHIAAH